MKKYGDTTLDFIPHGLKKNACICGERWSRQMPLELAAPRPARVTVSGPESPDKNSPHGWHTRRRKHCQYASFRLQECESARVRNKMRNVE